MEKIYYKSTRSDKEKITSCEAIVKGIADDGGLYIPSFIPILNKPFSKLVKMDYRQLAFFVMHKFLPDFSEEELKFCIERAYDKKFDTQDIAPLVKIGDMFFLELYHGATASFKDMALSILPYLLTTSVRKTGVDKEIVILTATSGDTGKAALESFSDVEGTKIIVFYPDRGVSLVQERQMITQEGSNTFVCAIEGNFDDAQTQVKNIFADKVFGKMCAEKKYMFSSANSINVGRLIPQVAYYINSYARLLGMNEIEQGDRINIVVPTGNFGNILAAYYARAMGLPVNKLICAANENNVLYDFFNTGVYNRLRQLKLTISPSMDILISSNLERLIYDICGMDSARLKRLFADLSSTGIFSIDDKMMEKIKDFWSGFATDAQTIEAIREVYKKYNYLIDTHTAVGYYVYKQYLNETGDNTKTIIASTASPFKFPASVVKAVSDDSSFNPENVNEFELLEKLSEITEVPVPEPLRDIGTKKILHRNFCRQDEMKDFVAKVLDIY